MKSDVGAPIMTETVCIGAGPAGLTAAYMLAREGRPVIVLEGDPVHVGGISRTVDYRGYGVDIGGHRFFSKSAEVEALWREMLGEPFRLRPRKSRIFYRRKLFDYPLRAGDALLKLGPFEAARCVLSYLAAAVAAPRQARTFEDWVSARFGRRLFEIFFKSYTEKVWGMKCSEISADWAAQRIKGLSLFKALWCSVRPQTAATRQDRIIKTLVDQFHYPRRGPGMLWEAAARTIQARGGQVRLGRRVTGIRRDAIHGRWIVDAVTEAGERESFGAQQVISSMPIRDLVRAIRPGLPARAHAAAEALRYRDFLVVALILRERNRFDDNWIYIHEPGVKVGRIQNFKSWSPDMVPDPTTTCYGLEYFCFEGDGLWATSDADLIRLATDELARLGLAEPGDVLDGTVVRQPKAYPIYDAGYTDNVAVIREEIERACPGLHLVGRNGMHKYNNQDHAMMTAMLTARNIMAGRKVYDVWSVNQDAEYHEDVKAGEAERGGRLVPAPVMD